MNSRAVVIGCLAAAAALGLAGCTAEPVTGPSPSVGSSEAASPRATPTPSDLVIPADAEGEIARVVFVAVGPEGVPTSTKTISDIAIAGTPYVLDAQCEPLGDPVPIAYSVVAAGDEQRELTGGAFLCDGSALSTDGTIEADGPVEVSFTMTDGVWQAYARLIPAG